MLRYAVLGDPISHSRSPEIYNALFEKYGIEACFSTLRAGLFEAPCIRELTEGLSGFALTMPLKRAVIPFLDSLDPSASCGAVNIVKREGERLIGCNTDGEGAADALLEKLPALEGLKAAILGRGGAALACAAALRKRGCEAVHLVRSACSDDEIVIGDVLYEDEPLRADIFINASPLGMDGAEPFAYFDLIDILQPRAVLDMVYRPGGETELVRASKELGLIAIAGERMLLNQALRAFEIWFGFRPDPPDGF